MISISSGLVRPVLVSVSTPRSVKICTAAGESLSAMRTRGMDALRWRVGPLTLPSPPEGERNEPLAPRGGEREGPNPQGWEGEGLGRHLELGDGLGEGPVEPGQQGLDVGGLHRRA